MKTTKGIRNQAQAQTQKEGKLLAPIDFIEFMKPFFTVRVHNAMWCVKSDVPAVVKDA